MILNIIVIGAGYVGLVTGACFAELGNHVTCVDVNAEKIADLNKNILPIYEPGLEQLIQANKEADRLHFTTSLTETWHADLIFIAVGTPSGQDGSADIQYVLSAARDIGRYISHHCIIVDKSTVPVGMAEEVKVVIQRELQQRGVNTTFDVVSNPEFLREGAAIEDFMQPDRVIVGLESEHAKNTMLNLYLPLLRNPEKIYFMSIKDAEMTKYAANAMLATRISFMNELALLCEKMDVDIENVRLGIGSDSRIGPAFLYAGCGYGGSCFPKDVRALIRMAQGRGIDPLILHAVEERNRRQKLLLAEKVVQIFGEDLVGKVIAVWGLAFKPETDDMRDAPSILFIEEMLKHGAKVLAYDPVAMPLARKIFPPEWFTDDRLVLCENQYDAVDQVDVLTLITEWKPFCYPDKTMLKNRMNHYIIIDGRNQYDPADFAAAGFTYYGIGRSNALPTVAQQVDRNPGHSRFARVPGQAFE